MRRLSMIIAAAAVLLAPAAASAHRHGAKHEAGHVPSYQDPEYPDHTPPAHQQVFESDVTGNGYPDAIGTPTPGQEGLEKRCRTWNGQYEPPKGC